MLDALDHALRPLRIAEGNEHLIEHDVVEDLAASRGKQFGEAPRLRAIPLDQLGETHAPERAQRRPHLDAARATRQLRRVVARVALLRLRRQILRRDRHRGLQRVRIADEREPAVVGHVEPLVRVGRPRVGVGDTGAELRARGSRRGPEAERAVNVHPCARGVRLRANLRNGVERARVHVARLHAHDGRTGNRRQFFQAQAALSVDRHLHDPAASEAEHAERFCDRWMHFLADDDGDRRRAEEALRLDVPACALEHRVPRRGKCTEIGNRRAGDERARRLAREREHVQQPSQRHLLDVRCAGRRAVIRAVLIPRVGQPVGRERRRKRAADDEAKKSRARHAHCRGRAGLVEQAQSRRRVGRVPRQRLVERAQPGDRRRGRRHGAAFQIVEITDRAVRGVAQQCVHGRQAKRIFSGTGRPHCTRTATAPRLSLHTVGGAGER